MLEIIIPYINTRIESLDMFQNLFGLCEIITKDGKSFPAEYCNGEYKQVSDFDLEKGVIYHRLIDQIDTQEAEEETTVSCDPFYIKTFPLRTVACINKKFLKAIGDNAYLETKIAQNIANTIVGTNNKNLRIDLMADSISIETNSIITNKEDLFSEEYKGIDNFIRYEYLYIAIDYSVIVTGNVSCFQLYDC